MERFVGNKDTYEAFCWALIDDDQNAIAMLAERGGKRQSAEENVRERTGDADADAGRSTYSAAGRSL